MASSKAEVLAWLKTTGKGYKQAARHFGLPPDTIRGWARGTPRTHTRTPARESVAGVEVPEVLRVPGRPVDRYELDQDAESRVAGARRAVGELTPGIRLVGMMRGRYWLLDLVQAVLEVVGPAELDITSWAIGAYCTPRLVWLRETGRVSRLRVVADRALLSLADAHLAGADAGACGEYLVAALGAESIRLSRVHCKIALISVGDWRLAIRSSANMSANPRWEQWELDDCPEIWGFFKRYIDEVYHHHAPPSLEKPDQAAAAASQIFAAGERQHRLLEREEQLAEALQPMANAVDADPVSFWSARLTACLAAAHAALDKGHSGAGASWEKLASAARVKLDQARAVQNPEAEIARLLAAADELIDAKDSRRRMLAERIRLREEAERAGSHIAAARHSAEITRMMGEIHPAQPEAEADLLDPDLAVDDVLEMPIEVLKEAFARLIKDRKLEREWLLDMVGPLRLAG